MKYAIFTLPVLLLTVGSAYAETTIGRWCSKTIPNMPKYNQIMEIVALDDGNVVLRSSFGDGSTKTDKLEESAGNLYKKAGSGSGDKYRIVASSGNLQLLDNDGLVRTAKKLENSPQKGECSS